MPEILIDRLTPREREILTMIAEGDSLPEIAQKLHRSLKTIESHRLAIGRKLSASNRVELTKIAIAAGLVAVGGCGPEQPKDDSMSARELAWLTQVNDEIDNTIGKELLERFCKAASTLPGIDVAAICTLEPTTPGPTRAYSRMMMAIADRGELTQPQSYHAAKPGRWKRVYNLDSNHAGFFFTDSPVP